MCSTAVAFCAPKQKKNEPNNFGSFFHILVCNRTCDNACIVRIANYNAKNNTQNEEEMI